MRNIRDEIREILERSTSAGELVSALDRISRRSGHRVRLKASGDTVRVGVGRQGWYQTEWLEWRQGWRCVEPSSSRYGEAFDLLLAVFDIDTHAGL